MKTLLVVDMQKDFMPGGPLGVDRADLLIPEINAMMQEYDLVIATKDWHPKEHKSFASNHSGRQIGDLIQLDGIEQILWPDHCVQNTPGAEFAEGFNQEKIDHIIEKGTNPMVDSYSAFFDNARKHQTGLARFLKEKKIDSIDIVGVATDYCVLFSVLDALDLGFNVRVLSKGCAGINQNPGDEKRAFARMRQKGALVI